MNKSLENRLQILVATHKRYDMPEEKIYLPIHVGKEGKSDLGYIEDNTGENISHKNNNYCELTALYWSWKNMNCDYIGLCHYRRYFSNGEKPAPLLQSSNRDDQFSQILTEKTISEMLNKYDIILPKKRNYIIETISSHYKHAHNIEDLMATKEIIRESYPEYLDSFDTIMNGRKLHLYNMFVMSKAMFDNYAEWLFDILEKLESKINITNYNPYQARVYGFISERLFNVWIHHHNLNIKELDIVSMENESKLKKYMNFLNRKIRGNTLETN
jgi:hypothetical protein